MDVTGYIQALWSDEATMRDVDGVQISDDARAQSWYHQWVMRGSPARRYILIYRAVLISQSTTCIFAVIMSHLEQPDLVSTFQAVHRGATLELSTLNSSKASGWKVTLGLFFITSIIESLGMSHIFAFLPVYLQQMHVANVETWVGLLNALMFVIGLPLVPLWGVWANRLGGKAVIIRSAYVEMIVFLALGFSHSFLAVVISMMLVGFQLGNTGIMLASIRRLVSQDRVGFAVSLFSVSSPIGMAVGPLVGGALTASGLVSLHGLYELDGILSLLTGTMLLLLYREVRTPDGVEGTEGASKDSAWMTAWKSVRYVFSLRITWILFGVYTLVMMGRQMVNPYVPLVIEHLRVHMTQTTVLIGVLMGLTAFVGAVITVFAGRLGDKVGFTRILCLAFAAGIPAALLVGVLEQFWLFTASLTVFSAVTSIGGAMVFALFSTRIPPTHRSTALNLVYLPLYIGGIIGPALSSFLSSLANFGPFMGASLLFACGLAVVWWTLSQDTSLPASEGVAESH